MDLPARMEMPARTKNGSEHWRCERLVTYEYTMNSARMNNSSATSQLDYHAKTWKCRLKDLQTIMYHLD